MTPQRNPTTTRRLRTGIAGLGLVLGLALAGCSSAGSDDAATTPAPSASASADAAAPAPEATTEGGAAGGDDAAIQAATLDQVRDFTCGLKDKDVLEESDVQAYRDLATEAQNSGVPNAEAYGEQINAGADQMAARVGQPLPDDLRASLSAACQSLQ